MTPIYLDNAASTRVADEVIALMTEVMRTAWGNPSAAHPQGAAARTYIDQARTRMLAALGDRSGIGDIVWTSGCTEADALAVLGAARVRPGTIVLTAVEHPAVSAAAKKLDGERRVVTIPVGKDGLVDPDSAAEAAEGAAVVAIVMVQNEIGVTQPVAQIAAAVRKRTPSCHIHVDAAQAFGHVPVDVDTLGVDSIAIAGHKLHGPKGVGALWLRNGVTVEPLWVGGGQQRGLRGGTQDAPGTAGLGLAAERAATSLPMQRTRWLELANIVTEQLNAAKLPYRQLVPDVRRSPHILALGFPGVPAGALRTVLSSRGVYLSTGSSCAERDAKPSAVLAAIELPEDTGMCRLSFGHDTTADEVTRAIGIIVEVARGLKKSA
jgi:cysteine desulfurase